MTDNQDKNLYENHQDKRLNENYKKMLESIGASAISSWEDDQFEYLKVPYETEDVMYYRKKETEEDWKRMQLMDSGRID